MGDPWADAHRTVVGVLGAFWNRSGCFRSLFGRAEAAPLERQTLHALLLDAAQDEVPMPLTEKVRAAPPGRTLTIGDKGFKPQKPKRNSNEP